MAENTKIQWADHTWNPWIGCSRVHTGCRNCYAEAKQGRFGVTWGPSGTRRKTSEAYWKLLLAWNRKAEREGERIRVFPSLCDPFEDWDLPIIDHNGWQLMRSPKERYGPKDDIYPSRDLTADWEFVTMDDLRRDFFRLIDQTPNIDYLLLTKRPENIMRMTPDVQVATQQQADDANERHGKYRPNVWLVYSASDQETLERGHGYMRSCRDLAPVLGYSLEPLIGPIDFSAAMLHLLHDIDWVVVGGESGPNARQCCLEWIANIVQQCREAAVPCFVKQLGARAYSESIPDDMTLRRESYWLKDCDGRAFLVMRDKKGGDWSEWPEALRVREFPR